MPRLAKGGKWTFGWVIVGSEREIVIPPDAWDEYGFRVGDEAILMPGSKTSGGFGLSRPALLAEAREKSGAGLRELGRGRFGEGRVVLPAEVGARPGERFLTVRGSGYGLGFAARGPIYQEACKHPELDEFS